jgi:hypothetical protein
MIIATVGSMWPLLLVDLIDFIDLALKRVWIDQTGPVRRSCTRLTVHSILVVVERALSPSPDRVCKAELLVCAAAAAENWHSIFVSGM